MHEITVAAVIVTVFVEDRDIHHVNGSDNFSERFVEEDLSMNDRDP